MVLELSITDTLEPRAAFLRGKVCVPEGSLGKLISRHPQILTCSEDSMQQRVAFLIDLGLEAVEVGKVVLAHPQVLHYKIDSMNQRVDYLRSIGLNPKQVVGAVLRLPQLFSLNVEVNMAPKFHFLVEHLGGSVQSLASYPGYFSLSLSQR
jgi:mTERF domain-containing protein